jgi:hypothetical protein
MATAFQSSAFQTRAFQITVQRAQLVGFGAGILVGRRKKRKPKAKRVLAANVFAPDEEDEDAWVMIDNHFLLLLSD